jgi:putative ATP-dependent endonuclease of the OLD family
MYLSELKLWNFRKFGSNSTNLDLTQPDIVIPFSKGLNVLIGENDSGKTAIIDAIKLVLDTHSSEWVRTDIDDFHGNSTRLRIECRFDALSDDEAKNFTEWLGMDGGGADAIPYLRVMLDASRQDDKILPFDIRAGVDEDGYQLTAEARNYLKTAYLKPLRDAKSELMPRKGSRLSQILIGHEAFKNQEANHLLTTEFRKFKEAVEKYFRGPQGDDDKGKLLRRQIEDYLEGFFGQKKSVNFLPADKKLKEILEILKLSLEEENLGLGSHNLLFIATELLNLERSNWNGLRLGLIEELEAHLHPQAQLKVISHLQALTEREGSHVQLILTTHSPNLGSRVKLSNLIICCNGRIFPMGFSPKKYTKLEEPDYKFLERFLDVTKANLLFARGVILVEGWAEELILPTLAQKLDCDLTTNGVSIVNVASTAFLRYSKIFQRTDDVEMDIHVSVITDLDIKPDEEKIIVAKVNKTNAQINDEAKKKKYNGQKVQTFVSPHWTLEYCLAHSQKLGSLFIESVREIYKDISIGNEIAEIEKKLETRNLKRKAEIAQVFAEKIKDSSISKIDLESDLHIQYLVNAIKYATRN